MLGELLSKSALRLFLCIQANSTCSFAIIRLLKYMIRVLQLSDYFFTFKYAVHSFTIIIIFAVIRLILVYLQSNILVPTLHEFILYSSSFSTVGVHNVTIFFKFILPSLRLLLYFCSHQSLL